MQKLKMIPCPKCGVPFPELRKTQYGYNFCVECSSIDKVVGITTVEGSGDHTYNDLIIMDRKTAHNIAKHEAEVMGRKMPDAVEMLDMDRDESEVSQSIKEKVHKVLDDEDSTYRTPQREDHDPEDATRIKGIDY
jgi:hypothetical protein